MNSSGKESYLTRADLNEALTRQRADIEQLFNAKLDPVLGHQKEFIRVFYGRTGANGLVGSVKVLQWGYALLVGVMIFFAKEVFKL